MAKRFTDTDKWKKKWFRSLSNDHKVFWQFILDQCNHAGIWDVDFEFASIFCGDLNEEEIRKAFNKQFQEIDGGKRWFIKDFVDFQYGSLNANNNLHKSVLSILEKVQIEPLTNPSSGAMVKVKDRVEVKDKVKVKAFTPPTLDEVKAHFKAVGTKIDPETFHAYYESNGWKLASGVPVKKWQACLTTWEKRRKDFTPSGSNTVGSNGKPPAEVVVLTCIAQKMDDVAITQYMTEKGYSEHRIVEAIGKARGNVQ